VGNRITRFRKGGGGSEDLHVRTDDVGAGHQVREVGQGGGGVRICLCWLVIGKRFVRFRRFATMVEVDRICMCWLVMMGNRIIYSGGWPGRREQ
jgi:hypothetical protein